MLHIQLYLRGNLRNSNIQKTLEASGKTYHTSMIDHLTRALRQSTGYVVPSEESYSCAFYTAQFLTNKQKLILKRRVERGMTAQQHEYQKQMLLVFSRRLINTNEFGRNLLAEMIFKVLAK